MAVWSKSQATTVSASARFDPEFFLPEFLNAEQQLFMGDTTRVLDQFTVSDGNHLSVSRFFTKAPDAIPYFRGQDLNGFFLGDATPVRIPREIYTQQNMRRSHFAEEDVLICIVGASTGTISVATNTSLPSTGSCKIGIIRKKADGLVDPYVLAAFMSGYFGQLQVKRHSRGTAQGGLILKDIPKLLVPLFSTKIQNGIRDLVRSSIQLNAQARDEYISARQLFEQKTGFTEFNRLQEKKKGSGFSTVSLNEITHARRIDAQCFSLKAIEYQKFIRTQLACEPLGGLQIASAKGRQQSESHQGSHAYCSIKHLERREVLTNQRCNPTAGTQFAEVDNLLLAITGATIGKVGILKRNKTVAFSGDLLCLRTNEKIDSHYLLLVLDHPIGQTQLVRWISGSTNGHLSERDANRTLIPRLSSSDEFKLSGLVQTSLKNRLESESRLRSAISQVEVLVTNGTRK